MSTWPPTVGLSRSMHGDLKMAWRTRKPGIRIYMDLWVSVLRKNGGIPRPVDSQWIAGRQAPSLWQGQKSPWHQIIVVPWCDRCKAKFRNFLNMLNMWHHVTGFTSRNKESSMPSSAMKVASLPRSACEIKANTIDIIWFRRWDANHHRLVGSVGSDFMDLNAQLLETSGDQAFLAGTFRNG